MNAARPDFRLKRLTGEFADRATERAFRRATFRPARTLNRIALSIIAGSTAAHIVTDQMLYGFSAIFYQMLVLRSLLIGALLLVFPIMKTTRPTAHIDAGIFAIQIYLVASFATAFLIIPTSFLLERVTVQSVTALLILLGQYLFVSNRLHYSAIAGIALSASYIAVTIITGRVNVSTTGLEAMVHLLANVLGFFSVYRAGVLRRRQYAMTSAQAELNRRLEAQARQLETQARELGGARDEALQANRAKSEFLAYMSHELRSPMNAIIGFSEIMKREMMGPISPPKYREYAEDIHGSATHLLSLINDILDLSRAEAGKLRLNETEVDLAAAVEAVRRLVAVRAEDSHIALRIHLARQLPALTGDARIVKQMILNLLSNAIKFTPARGSVTLTAGTGEAGAVFISIADTGPGIATADLPRILEAYGRTDAAEKAATEGTGLGLTLVKAMIELHGGTLDIESKPGAGSTFTLRFPPERTALAKAA